MTTRTDTPPAAADTTATHRRVRWRDLVWITWKQHRLMLTGTGVIVFVGAILMALLSIAAGSGGIDTSVLMFAGLEAPANLLEQCLLGYGAVVAAFWAAPLLAREYEQRTHLFAWSQDVSALRWVAGKTLLLATVAVVFGVLLGTTGKIMLHQYNEAATTSHYGGELQAFTVPFFGASPLVQAGYALFGFALGLLLSALCKRTVLSMGLTLVTFIVVRGVVAGALRPRYEPPMRRTQSLDDYGMSVTHNQELYVGGGYLDSSGNPVSYPDVCNLDDPADNQIQACLKHHDVTRSYTDYQPIERLGTFQLIEFGVFTALALLLFAVTWRLMRRTTRL